MKNLINFTSVFFLMMLNHSLWAQCGTESVDVTNYCNNQYAEFEITNPQAGVQYQWYQKSLTDTVIYNTGANFASPVRFLALRHRLHINIQVLQMQPLAQPYQRVMGELQARMVLTFRLPHR